MAKPTSTPQTRGTAETLPCGRRPSLRSPPGPPLNAPRTQQALPEDAQVRLLSLCYPSSAKGGLPEEVPSLNTMPFSFPSSMLVSIL